MLKDHLSLTLHIKNYFSKDSLVKRVNDPWGEPAGAACGTTSRNCSVVALSFRQ
jgi:hypothetical protein